MRCVKAGLIEYQLPNEHDCHQTIKAVMPGCPKIFLTKKLNRSISYMMRDINNTPTGFQIIDVFVTNPLLCVTNSAILIFEQE